MAACESCWDRAYINSRMNGTSQVDEYRKLIATECPEGAPLSAEFLEPEEDDDDA